MANRQNLQFKAQSSGRVVDAALSVLAVLNQAPKAPWFELAVLAIVNLFRYPRARRASMKDFTPSKT